MPRAISWKDYSRVLSVSLLTILWFQLVIWINYVTGEVSFSDSIAPSVIALITTVGLFLRPLIIYAPKKFDPSIDFDEITWSSTFLDVVFLKCNYKCDGIAKTAWLVRS
jgi:hypothetical protein